ncbi:NAD(P)-dependent oxidoreductase [Spirochaetia bacterium]|nr:NAD(P)-dependent oxidoreductase [Spirochaetia bacterium]
MKKIAVLGTTGMLGNAVFKVMKDAGFDVVGTTRRELDAETTTIDDIQNCVKNCDYIINCIGFIKHHIDDKNKDDVERAIKVNSLFPHKLAKCGIKIIQIATDCVYDGVKGNYIETDLHNPTDVYGKTKSLGEINAENFMNLRCSIFGREIKNKLSNLEWFLSQPKNGKVYGYKNHFWNGVSVLAFAKICRGIINNDFWFSGLQHVVASDCMSKADLLKYYGIVFNRKDITITNIDASQSINRTINTNNNSINKELWKMADYTVIPTMKDMIIELKEF